LQVIAVVTAKEPKYEISPEQTHSTLLVVCPSMHGVFRHGIPYRFSERLRRFKFCNLSVRGFDLVQEGRALCQHVLTLGQRHRESAHSNRIYQCATSKDVYKALDTVKPGDTIMLQGGKVYEIDKSFKLYANGSDRSRITLTSKDSTDLGRYAVISTVGQKKEEDLVALRLSGSFWNFSRIEITGKKVSLDKDYWNTHGFRIGLYLLGSRSHHNIIEDVHIHHTHNAAVAIRDESHHNTFRRMKIHHIGEWLDKDYDAHEGEGFYIGSSKGLKEGEKKARVHNIIIEESILGPGLLGQYIDIKYAASFVTARNNILYCYEKSYNEEVIKLAGFANVIKDNKFIGSNKNLTQYIRILNKKTDDPIKVDYLDQNNIPAPTGRDNTVVNRSVYRNLT
jgi:hypothetical protein